MKAFLCAGDQQIRAIMRTEHIRSRRSVRRYTANPIPKETIDDILDCARLAPTAMNLQPWLIGAVTDKTLLAKLADLLDYGKFAAGCAACFVVFCDKSAKYYLEDGAAATMNLIHAAWANGIGTCWVAGDKKKYADELRRLLNVPDKYTLVSVVPAGFPDETPSPKAKKGIAEVSFRDRHP